jgi:thiamine pyrophosphokinase
MKNQDVCLIISGGEFVDLPPEILKADHVIACDRGLDHADRYGIVPDLVIGDCDSVSSVNLEKIRRGEIKSECYPKEKDDTDTILAMKHAVDLGYKDIRIICAFGRRPDHAFSNIQTAHYGAEHGALVRIYDEETEVIVFSSGTVTVPRKDGYGLSVFSLTDVCRSVSIRGTKYELEDGELTNSFPLGQSNEFKSDFAQITLSQGVIMIIICKNSMF